MPRCRRVVGRRTPAPRWTVFFLTNPPNHSRIVKPQKRIALGTFIVKPHKCTALGTLIVKPQKRTALGALIVKLQTPTVIDAWRMKAQKRTAGDASAMRQKARTAMATLGVELQKRIHRRLGLARQWAFAIGSWMGFRVVWWCSLSIAIYGQS